MGNVVRFEPLQPVGARFFFEKYREGFIQFVVIIAPVRPGFKTPVFDQLRMLNGIANPSQNFCGDERWIANIPPSEQANA